MPPSGDLVVFGIASSGSVEQWDGHASPVGILLRWSARPELGYPDLGFEVARANVPDIPALPFNDLNVPLVEGKPSWTYAERITLSAPSGLQFEPSGQLGWWRLVIAPGAPVTITFVSPAWLVVLNADAGTSELVVRGFANGAVVREERLSYPGQRLEWRSRGVESLALTGTGTVSFVGFHLLDDPLAWTSLAHRCLPVIDPAYPCGPQPGGSEADEARSRLPPSVAAEWAARFDAGFAALLPALRRLASHAAPVPLPTATGRPDVKLAAGERDVIALASLDPHGARMLGLAYDDALGGALDGREYAYKVVGRWLGAAIELDFGASPNLRQLEREYGLSFRAPPPRSRASEWSFRFAQPVHEFSLELQGRGRVTWKATTAAGTLTGALSGNDVISLSDVVELTLSTTSARDLRLGRARWKPIVERVGLLPGIVAVEPGAPAGPTSLAATLALAASPSAIATADLDWQVPVAADGSTPEGAPISYQLARQRFTADPSAPVPTPGPPTRKDLVDDGAPIFVSADRARQPFGARVLYTDRNGGIGFGAGWWGWWVRGVDLFGRVSAASAWGLAAVRDTAPPPAPVMVQAEWVQRDLPATTVAVLGRSTEAKRWLVASGAAEGLVTSWAYGPEQASVRPDVDGFELLVRRASAAPGAAADAALVYPPWPAAVARYGPTALSAAGHVAAATRADPVLAVAVSSVQRLPPAPNAKPGDPVRSALATDLELDGAASAFVGGSIELGGTAFPVVASGDGSALGLVVEHAVGAGPQAGAGQLRAPVGVLVWVTTDIPALTPPAGLRVRSGVLVVGTVSLPVLRRDAGDFLCFALGAAGAGAALTVGDAASWYPVWSAALDDSGFGPLASATAPVANAQVAVRAVRDVAGFGLVSSPSASLTVTAVDLTPPVTPITTTLAFDADAPCTHLASRADWYGRSYFTLAWGAQADRTFIVYRALGDEIARLDRLELEKGGRRATNFPVSTDYPPGVEGDAARRARVLADLAAIDAARATLDNGARAEALETAYEALSADTQMLLARQDYSWGAYAPVFPEPISAASWEDTLDGRSHGHWFYRVTSRTAAGIESAPSEPTPPICCPDVVPPAVPLVHMALADDNAVKLRWLASPDRDLDHYDIYAARDASAVEELASMTPIESWVPPNRIGGVVLERSVPREPGEWYFWIVAVDESGNKSAPSTMLKGRALRPPPEPPVWVSAERTPAAAPDRVTLTWTHPSDARLATLVERRPTSGGMWAAISPWLPRGTYQYEDRPLDLDAAWDYRLRVQDHLSQVASTLPVITLGTA